MKRIYTSQTVKAGNVNVIVRQVLGFSRPDAPAKVAAAVLVARTWMPQAISQVRSAAGMTTAAGNCFKHCFNTEEVLPRDLQRVYWVLMAIQMGLCASSLAIKVRRMRTAAGHVRGGPTFDMEDGEPVQTDFRAAGEIHLDYDSIGNKYCAARVLIHEAGHKFARLCDLGYLRPETMQYIDAPPSRDQTLRNADSYAFFVYMLTQPAVADRILRNARHSIV